MIKKTLCLWSGGLTGHKNTSTGKLVFKLLKYSRFIRLMT